MVDEPGLGTKSRLYSVAPGALAAIVKQLAADGTSVALTYAKSPDKAAETARAAEALGVRYSWSRADSADPAAVKDAVEQTLHASAASDILVVTPVL